MALPIGRTLLVLALWTSATATAPLDLPNWMGQLEPIMGNATLLDLSLPGAHDAMTYDLSDTVSEGYEGLGPVISKILHAVTPLIAGKFIRTLGQTQGLNVTSMLDSGVRFLDFRIMYSDAPDSIAPHKDWYCLHGCQTRHTALSFLPQVHKWLERHPREIVVFYVSRHGNPGLTGTAQYPGTTPAQRQKFFKEVCKVFGSMLFDSSEGQLNTTTVAELWQRGQRVVWYAADYVESTENSSLALDARVMDHEHPGAGSSLHSLTVFRNGTTRLANNKHQNLFFLMSMALSGPTCQEEAAARITFLPLIGKEVNIKKCAKCFGIPGLKSWCPMSLQEVGQLTNYYNQLALETAYREGSTNEAVDAPNAIILDGIDEGGRFRTGTARLNPLSTQEHETEGYAYTATLVGMTARRLCRRISAAAACAAVRSAVEASRAQAPLRRWSDPSHGRRDDWPQVPPPPEMTFTV